MTDDPPATDRPHDHEPTASPGVPGAAPWLVLIAGVAVLLLLFVALALIAMPAS